MVQEALETVARDRHVDEERITRTTANGRVEAVRWDDLREIGIVTTNEGPYVDDVFWVLIGDEGRCIVPSETEGMSACSRVCNPSQASTTQLSSAQWAVRTTSDSRCGDVPTSSRGPILRVPPRLAARRSAATDEQRVLARRGDPTRGDPTLVGRLVSKPPTAVAALCGFGGLERQLTDCSWSEHPAVRPTTR
jgi:hypothetical protein